jgi:hypothetical protein
VEETVEAPDALIVVAIYVPKHNVKVAAVHFKI